MMQRERIAILGLWAGVIVSACGLLAFWQGYRIGRGVALNMFASPPVQGSVR